MIAYLFLCLVSLGLGLSLSRLFRGRGAGIGELFLAPALTAAFWTISLCAGASFGLEVRAMTPILWPVSVVLALAGLPRLRRVLLLAPREAALAVLAIACPMILLAPYFLNGLDLFPGSWFWDRWYYVAKGASLWRDPGTADALSPLYRFAGLYPFRYAGAALLGFFSPLGGEAGDVSRACGLFLAWSCFVFSAASLFFVLSARFWTRWRFYAAYAVLVTVSGWVINLVIANNFDNLLALGLLPVLLGLLRSPGPSGDGRPWEPGRRESVMAGTLLAAGLYIFPEYVPFMTGCVLSFLVTDRLAAGERPCPARIARIARIVWPAALAALLLILPAIRPLWALADFQTGDAFGAAQVRPGLGYYPGLLVPWSFIPAYFGFEPPLMAHDPVMAGAGGFWGTLASALALGLAVMGVERMWREKRRADLAALVLLAGCQAVMLFYFSYDYGASKLIVLAWFLTAALVVHGMWSLDPVSSRAGEAEAPDSGGQAARSRPGRMRVILAAAPGLLTLLFACTAALNVSMTLNRDRYPMTQRELAPLGKAAGLAQGKTIAAVLRDPRHIPWALYALRDAKLLLAGEDHPYFHPAAPGDGEEELAGASFLLSDEPWLFPARTPSLICSPFLLWTLPKDWMVMRRAHGAYGGLFLGGVSWNWLGEAPLILEAYSSFAGAAVMRARIVQGPDPHGGVRTRLTMSVNGGPQRAVPVSRGDVALAFEARKGVNRILLRAVTDPPIPAGPGRFGPKRLLGASAIRFEPGAG